MTLSAKVAAIDLSGDVARLLVVKTGGKLPKIIEAHACRAEYTDPEQRTEALIEAVKTVAGRLRTRPSAFVLCVSSAQSLVRTLAIPFRGKRKVAAAVQFEIERYLALPIEELIVDFLPVLEVEGQTEVLAVGIRRAVLREQLAILNAAGIDPESFDLDAAGVAGLWRAGSPALKGLNALLYFGNGGSILAVTHGKSLVYFRHLTFPACAFHEKMPAISQEVQNSLRAFHANWKGGGEVLSLSVAGVPVDEIDVTPFAEGFDIPVASADLLGKVKGSTEALKNVLPGFAQAAPRASSKFKVQSSELQDQSSEWTESSESTSPEYEGSRSAEVGMADSMDSPDSWAPLVGAALGAAGGGFSLQFRKQEFAYKQVFSGLVPHVVMASGLVLLLLVGLAWRYQHGAQQLNAEADSLAQRIKEVRAEVNDKAHNGINVDSEAFAESTLLDIFDEISQKLPDDKATITEVHVEPPGSADAWITIRGSVKDDQVFKSAFEDLKKSQIFKVDDDPHLKMESGKSAFKIAINRASRQTAGK